jgi:hypothetical protein
MTDTSCTALGTNLGFSNTCHSTHAGQRSSSHAKHASNATTSCVANACSNGVSWEPTRMAWVRTREAEGKAYKRTTSPVQTNVSSPNQMQTLHVLTSCTAKVWKYGIVVVPRTCWLAGPRPLLSSVLPFPHKKVLIEITSQMRDADRFRSRVLFYSRGEVIDSMQDTNDSSSSGWQSITSGFLDFRLLCIMRHVCVCVTDSWDMPHGCQWARPRR